MWMSPQKPGKRRPLLSDNTGMSFLSRVWPVDTWRRSSVRGFFGSKAGALHPTHKDLAWW
ncbi:uncharacterized protein CTRU02_215059 [Colletotrichum truncatum]|uniref:Uncharacterized protein n=1 Tax=Colletotrichum truncatum TaxID=5467 RepID=A0ACC3YEG8_COLTU|nr:uncharacterized protein CTRU02_08191 [Colletotrichum truncatum]KAF6790061.1 hypothetical protein CTRU02_08191 [Colletotrichum truncatum]